MKQRSIYCPYCGSEIKIDKYTVLFGFFPVCSVCQKKVRFKRRFLSILRNLLYLLLFSALYWFVPQLTQKLSLGLRILIIVIPVLGLDFIIDKIFFYILCIPYTKKTDDVAKS